MDWDLFGKKQTEFILTPLEEHKKIVILSGSVRSGKTIAMIPKWLEFIQSTKGLKLIVGVSKDTIYDNVLSDLFDTLGPDNYTYNTTNGFLKIKYKDESGKTKWTVCKVIGAKDEGSEKYLRGKTVAGAYVDEGTLIPQSFFKQLLNRCSVPGAKIFITTNPDSPLHYLYADYMNNPDKSNICEVWEFFLDDNPNLSQEYIDFIKSAYSGIEYDRFIKGIWKITKGRICPDFVNDCKLVNGKWKYGENSNVRPINYIPDLPLHICCDFNYSKPMMWVLAHIDWETETIFYFDEIVIDKATTEMAILEFIRRYPDHKSKIILNGDYAGTFGTTRNDYHDYAIMRNKLEEYGYKKIDRDVCPNPNIKWRIASFNNKIRKHDGTIQLYISPKCKWLIHNIENLQWKLGTDEIDLPSESDLKKNENLKYLGHLFDGASYPVFKYWPIKIKYT